MEMNIIDNYKNKIIVTPARSGSSWLVSAFERTGYIGAPLSLSESNKIFTDENVDLNKFQPYRDKIEFVWLYRENRVEHFLSNAIAWHKGQWYPNAGETYTTPTDLKFEEDTLISYEAILIHEQCTYRKYNHMFDYQIKYEDLIDNNPWGLVQTDDMPTKLNHYTPELLQRAEQVLTDWELL
jgi:LPS sulfotransferase NodH